MKKHLCYLLALMLTLSASCSKEPAELDFSDSAQGGNHRLTELSASLDDDETRTSLQTSNNNVVYWSTKDRILVVNTTTYESWYYELVSGVGTSVGKFEPLGEAATCNDDLSNIVAVYPAVAAVVDKAAKTLSFTVNNDWNKTDEGKKKLADCNIRSWNNDSPMNFSHNDIKVSYHVNGTANNANFKFRQLGTWCIFSFDFTADESVRKESLQSIEVTTTEGDVQISGTRQVDLSDPNQPTLIAKNASELTEADKSVAWTFNTAISDMTTSFTRSMMLFPGMENKQMKITAQTNLHTFVFYAKPQTKLEAGTVLRFPIGFKQNFNTEIQPDDDPLNYAMAYTAVEKELYPFYYYGNANCYLIAGTGNNSCTVDVTRHKASAFYEKNDAEATEAPQAAYAKVIWYETAMGEPSINGEGAKAAITGNEFTVTLADATKFGNALIGIYESETSETPLWSYHIWHPEDDPTLAVDPTNYKAMKLYENTYSGSYTVMPMPLGATNVVVADDTDEEKIKGAGLWYQWGRKDPLGRLNDTWDATNRSVTVPVENLSNSTSYFSSLGDGVNNSTTVVAELTSAGYVKEGELVISKDEVEIEGVKTSANRYMLQWAIKNPTKFISGVSDFYSVNWSGPKDNNLWGSSTGYNYPHQSQTYKSAFDPCPAGYRVPPMDLWLNFVVDEFIGNAHSSKYYYNVKGSGHGATDVGFCNKGFVFYYKGMGTIAFNADGIAVEYTEPNNGETDFYICGGMRSYKSGEISGTGLYGTYWNNTVSGEQGARLIYSENGGLWALSGDPRSGGFSVRCVKEGN